MRRRPTSLSPSRTAALLALLATVLITLLLGAGGASASTAKDTSKANRATAGQPAASAARRSRCRSRSARKRHARARCRRAKRHHRSTPRRPRSRRPATQTQPSAPAEGPDEQGFVPRLETQDMTEYDTSSLGGGAYDNATIADIGLSHLGQNLYTPGPLDHGQCKQAVNDWVAVASRNTQRLGGDYNSNYARNGGQQVGRDEAVKGDIIQLYNPANERQYYKGMHTAVVLSHAGGSNTFEVVDSNFNAPDVVTRHGWDPFASAARYGLRVVIWRMGTVQAPAAQPQPTQQQQQPQPQGPSGVPETTGGVSHTWTNPANAGGVEGPTIGANQTVLIACKLQGFRVADGNTWWYRIAQAPWNGQYYVSADAFYNNGATSGSLHGTPFVDNNVPNC